jgi:hypothetical protein
MASNPTPGTQDLHILQISPASDTKVASGGLNFLGWSTDSNVFLFSSADSHTTFLGQVGGASSPVPDIGEVSRAVWVDANRYIALTPISGGWNLQLGMAGQPTTMIAYMAKSAQETQPIFDAVIH